ncbi:hypothetical protein SLEP1_g22133 [Rubroshorea leprosula]|uniref:Uncharacterized protein n=1 Tax=Rubroshorea leprosula TaxID=152421 RepID=A0AAV5JDL2_9ROSI|nr:hypothetical protein SLEP1_g22133 [Rubroshorea leprosula]
MEMERRSGSEEGTIRSSNPENNIPCQQNDDGGNGSRGSSSRFKGIQPLENGKWGARISLRCKPYWLGTYEKEEEAAMAYDRAAIKLQRSDASLNFSLKNYTAQENIFQSCYSKEEVLCMLKDKTYSSNLVSFLYHQCLTTGSNSLKGEISYQMLFLKELTQTDLSSKKGLLIHKEYALKYFSPLIGSSSNGGELESNVAELTFYDKHRCSWTFQYSYWSSIQSYVFTRGWRHFVKMNNLNSRDIVIFYRCEVEEEGQNRVFHMIDIRHRDAEMEIEGKNAQHRMGAGENPNAGMKLFGVWIQTNGK